MRYICSSLTTFNFESCKISLMSLNRPVFSPGCRSRYSWSSYRLKMSSLRSAPGCSPGQSKTKFENFTSHFSNWNSNTCKCNPIKLSNVYRVPHYNQNWLKFYLGINLRISSIKSCLGIRPRNNKKKLLKQNIANKRNAANWNQRKYFQYLKSIIKSYPWQNMWGNGYVIMVRQKIFDKFQIQQFGDISIGRHSSHPFDDWNDLSTCLTTF